MSNENFRRELNNAVDQISGSPSPALRDRVRSSLRGASRSAGPNWIAAAAAAVIAILLVGVLVVANPLNRPNRQGPIAGTSPTPTPSAPAASPTPSPSLPAMVCATNQPPMTSSAPAVVFIDSLRTGTHAGYDRLTIEFKNGAPTLVDAQWQTSTTFTQSPSGQTLTVQGTHGILVTMHGADLHTDYTGSLDIKTGYSGLIEVRRVQDFEGVVQLALGVSGPGCYRWFFLSNPDRLVIDIQTS